VDPVPDPLLLRKCGSVGNGTRTSGFVARNSDHWTTDAVSGLDRRINKFCHYEQWKPDSVCRAHRVLNEVKQQANINLFTCLSHKRKLIMYKVVHRRTNKSTQLLQAELDISKWLSPQTPNEEYIYLKYER
jgi:hypothetical protein